MEAQTIGDPMAAAMQGLAAPQRYARDCVAVPSVRGRAGTGEPYEGDAAHQARCGGAGCVRCKFENGFAGRLRKGFVRNDHAACGRLSWRQKCTYREAGQQRTWITVRPIEWGGPWAVGCLICNLVGSKCVFARVEVREATMMQICTFMRHASTKAHVDAAVRMERLGGGGGAPLSGCGDGAPISRGGGSEAPLSGCGGGAPISRGGGGGAPLSSGCGGEAPISRGGGDGAPISGGCGGGDPISSGIGGGAPLRSGGGDGAPISRGGGGGAPLSSGGGGGAPLRSNAPVVGEVTGATDTVPRVDTFIVVLTTVARRGSLLDVSPYGRSLAVGSGLQQGGDGSSKVAGQCITCLAHPLREKDQMMMRAATKASIALDERDQLLVVFSRMLVMLKGKPYVYECMLGMARDYGTGAETCVAAIKSIIRRACIIRKGRRPAGCVDDDAMGEDDVFDKTLYDHFRSIVRVAVADGGPTEQKALHLCAPPPGAATGPPAMVQSAVFPNLLYITRDRAHRMRSVQRGTWDSMRSYVKEFLDLLVTGKHSLAKTIENSRKFSMIWEDSQRELREGGSIDVFSQTLRNMSYAEQRFDSRSQPLFVIFSMIPVAVRFFFSECVDQG